MSRHRGRTSVSGFLRVGDGFKEEAAGGGGPGGDVKIGCAATLQELFELLQGHLAGADFDEDADDAADHAPEEVGGFKSDGEQVVLFVGFGGVEDDEGRFVRPGGVFGGEADEVVFAGEELGGVLDGSEVEGVFDPPDVPFEEGGFAGGDLVDVGAGEGVVPGGRYRVRDLNALVVAA